MVPSRARRRPGATALPCGSSLLCGAVGEQRVEKLLVKRAVRPVALRGDGQGGRGGTIAGGGDRQREVDPETDRGIVTPVAQLAERSGGDGYPLRGGVGEGTGQ